MESYGKKSTFYALFLLMVAGMNGLVLTTDLFNLYVFLEVAAVAGYALVAYGQQSDNVEGAFKYLMLSVVATSGILLSLSFIYFMTGTLNLSLLAAQAGTAMNAKLIAVCLALFLMGFGLKVGVVPFHGWLPDAYPSAPAPISAMLSGVLGKVSGIYALLRVVFTVFGLTPAISHIFTALGVASMLGRRAAGDRPDRFQAHAGLLVDQPGRLHVPRVRRRHARWASRPACSTCSTTRSSRPCCSSTPAPRSTRPASATCASSAASTTACRSRA